MIKFRKLLTMVLTTLLVLTSFNITKINAAENDPYIHLALYYADHEDKTVEEVNIVDAVMGYIGLEPVNMTEDAKDFVVQLKMPAEYIEANSLKFKEFGTNSRTEIINWRYIFTRWILLCRYHCE